MGTPNPQSIGHSAQVEMKLHIGTDVFAIAQLGPGFFILKQPFEHPPTFAEVTLKIDGTESRWQVQLVDGINPNQTRTRTAPVLPPAEVLSQHGMKTASDVRSASRRA
jgi:hypothetical protein